MKEKQFRNAIFENTLPIIFSSIQSVKFYSIKHFNIIRLGIDCADWLVRAPVK